MKIGKYVTNLGVLATIAGAFGVYRQTKEMPGDARRYLLWLAWLVSVTLAVMGVAKEDRDGER